MLTSFLCFSENLRASLSVSFARSSLGWSRTASAPSSAPPLLLARGHALVSMKSRIRNQTGSLHMHSRVRRKQRAQRSASSRLVSRERRSCRPGSRRRESRLLLPLHLRRKGGLKKMAKSVEKTQMTRMMISCSIMTRTPMVRGNATERKKRTAS